MVQSGPLTPVGGGQSVTPSLLRQNSGLLSPGQGGSMPSHSPYSPRTQINGGNIGLLGNMNMNIGNATSLLNQSFGNGMPMHGVGLGIDMFSSADLDSMSGAIQGQHQYPNVTDNQQTQQIDAMQSFRQQFSVPRNQHPQASMGFGSNLGTVKMQPQTGSGDQNVQKREPHQLQPVRNMGQVKLDPQPLDSSSLLQQQKQQILLKMSRHSPLQQQQQRAQLQQQQHQQSLPTRPQVKTAVYEPGMCARRLSQFMYHQQHRPKENNIEFWRKFVAEYYSPNAKKRWCVSLYGSGSRQTSGVFPQDAWHCEICNQKPGRGFETTVEVLPRLYQIKYASGTLEELLYVDMPREYQNASGQIVLDYTKAIQESVFEQLRVVREGQLRIVFSLDLKISLWEFCARHHEELIPRRMVIPQVNNLRTVLQKYQDAVQNGSSSLSTQDLQNTCNSFVASARQLAKALEVPLVNDLGYTKRYVRCLQISEVVNSMKDLIDHSRERGIGPIESLANFPRRNCSSSSIHLQHGQQIEEPQTMTTLSSNHNAQSSSHGAGSQLAPMCNGVMSANNHLNGVSAVSTTATAAEFVHQQSSMNSRQETQLGNMNTPYVSDANAVQIPSASSSNSFPSYQPNTSSPFTPPTPSTPNNNPISVSHNTTNMNTVSSPANLSSMQHTGAHAYDADLTDPESFVQQILQEIMMTSQDSSSVNYLQQQQDVGNQMMIGGHGAVDNFNNLQF